VGSFSLGTGDKGNKRPWTVPQFEDKGEEGLMGGLGARDGKSSANLAGSQTRRRDMEG